MPLPSLALVCALGILLLTPQAAAGGGWWAFPHPNRSTVAPGQRVEVEATVTFSSAAAAEEARESGRFHVYLLRGLDYSVVERAMSEGPSRNWWSLGGAEAIQVAPVAVSVSASGFGKARAAFTVPELPPARYHLMLCEAACSKPLAELIPAEGFTIVADPATARMAWHVDRLERRLRNQAGELRAARADTDTALLATRNRRSEVEQLEASVSALEDEGRSAPRATPWAYAGWLVAGALAGALALLVLRRRRPGATRNCGSARRIGRRRAAKASQHPR